MENLNYEERKQALIEAITLVFDGVERGDGTTFYEGTVYDHGGGTEEVAEARAKDTEIRWQDVPDDTFRENYAAISFLDPEGFRYYLPALMVWYLRTYYTDGPDSNLSLLGSIIFHLQLSNDERSREYQLGYFEDFSAAESQTIARFLQFDADVEETLEKERQVKGVQEMVENGKSQLEIDAYVKYPGTSSMAQVALNGYWGRFL